MMAEMALRVCPSIHISIERKEPTIPTAASASTLFSAMLPTTAASVLDSTGSAIPAMSAGTASCCMRLKEISTVCDCTVITQPFKKNELQKYILYNALITIEGGIALFWKINAV